MAIKDDGWTLVDWDKWSGRTVWGYFDGAKQHYRIDYPVQATIAENELMRNAAQKAWKGDYHLVARVPLNVFHDENKGLSRAYSEGDDRYVSKWLNDGDNRAFRTKEGQV